MADRHSASMESGSTSAEEEGAGSCVVHPTASTNNNSSNNNNNNNNSSSNACETSMWEEWTQATNSNGDEVSTSNLQLPELCNTSSSRSLTSSFHHNQQGDMMQLSSWLSGFQPLNIPCSNTLSLDLTHNPDPAIDNPPTFMQLEAGLVINPDHHAQQTSGTGINSLYPNNQSNEVNGGLKTESGHNIVYGKSAVHPYQMQALGPESPSSPLAFHNGFVHPFGDHWDSGAAVRPTLMPWRSGAATTHGGLAQQGYTGGPTAFGNPDHSPTAINHLEGYNATRLYGHHHTTGMSASPGVRPRHTDIFVGPDGNFEAAPTGWAPPHQLYSYEGDHHHLSGGVSVVRPLKLMASLREAHGGGVNPMCTDQSNHHMSSTCTATRSFGQDHIDFLKEERRGTESNVEQSWPGKHRLELMEVDCEDDKITSPPLKRPNLAVDEATAALWTSHRMGKLEYTPSSLMASQALDMIAIGPALNTNGKPRARRGSATDPQSVYARHRRERINERLKTLQHLVPNGAKVDIVTMLEEAISYVKFLQLQVKLLRSDEYWMYATPNTYNGVDISNPPLQTQGLESSA